MKGNEVNDQQKLISYSCHRHLTVAEMDILEKAVYGSINRDGLKCRCWSKGEIEVMRKDPHLPDCPPS